MQNHEKFLEGCTHCKFCWSFFLNNQPEALNIQIYSVTVDQKQVLKIWENYVTELYDRPNRLETLETEPEKEVDTDEKGPYFTK